MPLKREKKVEKNNAQVPKKRNMNPGGPAVKYARETG
jgi:hypothetical protein